jgi:O-antigen/teichoic acid export membrane protein
MRVVSLRDRIASTRPLWADFVIAALVFWVVLLPFEYGGMSAVILPTVVAAGVLTLLLARRWRSGCRYVAWQPHGRPDRRRPVS